MLHCYYCNALLQFTPKFKRQAVPQNGNRKLLIKSEASLVCPVCNAEYTINIEITNGTRFAIEDLKQFGNFPRS